MPVHPAFARIALIGAPGAGKGTLCKRLIQNYNYTHISTGDLLRAAIRNKTPEGLEAQKYTNSGALVPPSIVSSLLGAELIAAQQKDAPIVLDGYPRTVEQAEALQSELNFPLTSAVFMDVPVEEVVERAARRLVHAPSGRTYDTVFSPPKVEGKDDETGEELTRRADDNPETVRQRLETFAKSTEPLREWYSRHGALVYVSGAETDEGKKLIEQDMRTKAIWMSLQQMMAAK